MSRGYDDFGFADRACPVGSSIQPTIKFAFRFARILWESRVEEDKPVAEAGSTQYQSTVRKARGSQRTASAGPPQKSL